MNDYEDDARRAVATLAEPAAKDLLSLLESQSSCLVDVADGRYSGLIGDRPNERKAVRTPRFTFDGVSLLGAGAGVAVAHWYGQDPDVHRVWALIGLGIVMGVLCGLRWYWGPPSQGFRRLNPMFVSGGLSSPWLS